MKNLLKTFSLPLLVLCFSVVSCTSSSKKTPVTPTNNNGGDSGNYNRLAGRNGDDTLVTTIAAINALSSGDIEVLFNERQQRYTIARNNPNFEASVRLAREAYAAKKPVKLFSDNNGQITKISWPTVPETNAYLEWYRKNLTDVDRPRNIDIAALDTTEFNLDIKQPWKVFRLCSNTIPDFATAKAIFNYCKQQICNVGPTQITPCIPFQYVKDGCFARAHKMRYIIETKYRYCSEKVFSFGNLDVKADLWGGCCIGWWYHVAPLVRVKKGRKIYCYVIDPSMFTEPVLLSTWLAAQENTTCDPGSDVTNYSIQPSGAYTPSDYPPNTVYSTDPNYTKTNYDLVFWNGWGPTCVNP